MRSTRNIFRRMERVEEQMLRAVMPRVSETDEQGLRPVPERKPEPVVRTLTYRLAEVR